MLSYTASERNLHTYIYSAYDLQLYGTVRIYSCLRLKCCPYVTYTRKKELQIEALRTVANAKYNNRYHDHLLFQYADRTWPLIILGIIMFVPGAYHLRIAYYAYRQYPGYSFDEIPEFD